MIFQLPVCRFFGFSFRVPQTQALPGVCVMSSQSHAHSSYDAWVCSPARASVMRDVCAFVCVRWWVCVYFRFCGTRNANWRWLPGIFLWFWRIACFLFVVIVGDAGKQQRFGNTSPSLWDGGVCWVCVGLCVCVSGLVVYACWHRFTFSPAASIFNALAVGFSGAENCSTYGATYSYRQ